MLAEFISFSNSTGLAGYQTLNNYFYSWNSNIWEKKKKVIKNLVYPIMLDY